MKSEKILIVDDHTDVQSQIIKILQNQDYEKIRSAVSRQEALAQVEQEPPDLILLSLTMPETDGYQICEQLHENEKTRRIPIIVISAQRSCRTIQVSGGEFQ